jgi:hypothetical protein
MESVPATLLRDDTAFSKNRRLHARIMCKVRRVRSRSRRHDVASGCERCGCHFMGIMHLDDRERGDPEVRGPRGLRLDTQSAADPAIHAGNVDVARTSLKMLETTTQAADNGSPLLRRGIRVQERIWTGRTINEQERHVPRVLPCIDKPVPPSDPGIACEQLERGYVTSWLSRTYLGCGSVSACCLAYRI